MRWMPFFVIGVIFIWWGLSGFYEGEVLGFARYSGYVSRADSPVIFYLAVCWKVLPGLVCVGYAIKKMLGK